MCRVKSIYVPSFLPQCCSNGNIFRASKTTYKRKTGNVWCIVHQNINVDCIASLDIQIMIYGSWIQIQIYVSCTCAIAYILASSYPQVHVYMPVSSHPYILIFLGSCTLGTCWYPCIRTSSYPQVYECFLVTLCPHILLYLRSCTLCACCYPRILISSYPQVLVLQELVGTLAFSHPHILRFIYSRSLLVFSHPYILISLGSCTLGAC